MAKAKEQPKRGPGQPRKIPASAIRRNWYATPEEWERLQREASRDGISVQELVRRRALGC